MALKEDVLTDQRCPDCGNFLSREEYEDIKERVEFHELMMQESQRALLEITKIIKTEEDSEKWQPEIKRVLPNWVPRGQVRSARDWRGYFAKTVQERKLEIKYLILEGQNTVVLRCKKCGYIQA